MKKFLLPACAAVLAVVAAVLLIVPMGGASGGYAERDANGDLVIRADDLTAGELTVLKFARDSKIELVATLDETGAAQAALGTCQSCMGSPKAYYTQNGELLQCNNCGLTFPLSVIGEEALGCHPIPIGEAAVSRNAEGLVIDSDTIAGYEQLFARVAAH